MKDVKVLSDIARTEPHAAYSAYTHGLQHRWNYVMRTIPGISPLLGPLETAIRHTFLPALLKSPALSDDERALLELPPRLGGMGITSPEKLAVVENLNSLNLTRSLTTKIIAQDAFGEIDQNEIAKLKTNMSKDRQQEQQNSLDRLLTTLPDHTARRIRMAQETGASNWLTSLPVRAKGFNLNKREFVDAVALRYGWPVEGIPRTCAYYGSPNNVDYTMTGKKNGVRLYPPQ